MFTMVQQQLPTGFRDDIGAVAERKDDVSQYVLGLCRSRQYTKISTPLVEYKDVLMVLCNGARSAYVRVHG